MANPAPASVCHWTRRRIRRCFWDGRRRQRRPARWRRWPRRRRWFALNWLEQKRPPRQALRPRTGIPFWVSFIAPSEAPKSAVMSQRNRGCWAAVLSLCPAMFGRSNTETKDRPGSDGRLRIVPQSQLCHVDRVDKLLKRMRKAILDLGTETAKPLKARDFPQHLVTAHSRTVISRTRSCKMHNSPDVAPTRAALALGSPSPSGAAPSVASGHGSACSATVL